MRIAINTRFLLPNKLEGIGWYTYELCRRLAETHPKDTFYFFFDRPYSKEFIFGSNVIPLVIPPPARHPLLWKLWFEISIPIALKIIRPDVFFSPDGYLSVHTNTPTLMTLHDLASLHYPHQVPKPVRQYYDQNVPRFLHRADCIVAISEFVKQDILAHYPIPSERIQVVGNGQRAGFYPLTDQEKQVVRNQYAEGKPYFFYFGALHPRKNLPRLIRAFDQFKAQTGAPLKLLIGGRMAWQTGEILQAWEASRCKRDIQFLGYLPENELPRILGGAFGLTYVSLFEGFGLPILEAFSCDVPVITSTAASMPEVAGDAALYANPLEEESIATAMRQLWEQPARAQELIQKGRIQQEKYTWERTAERIYNLLYQIKKAPEQ